MSELASLACHIQMDVLKQPSGKQDEHIAAFGGLMSFEIKRNGSVIAKPLVISSETKNTLQNNLLFFIIPKVRQDYCNYQKIPLA